MRITNKGYTPIEVLAELVAAVGVREEKTSKFFSGDRTNHDVLIRAFAEKVDVVLESFRRYGSEVAETQFVRDNGVDVRLVYEEGGEERRGGFQIKSENEAEAEKIRRRNRRPGESMIATLKRQAFEAEHKAFVHEWWIVSCFDLAKHRDLATAINSEVTSGLPGRLRIRHIEPRQAFSLLSKDDEEIDALCTLLLCEDDEFLSQARRDALRLSPIAKRLLARTLAAGFEGDAQVRTSDLPEFAGANASPSDLGDAVGQLEDSGYLSGDSGGMHYRLSPSAFMGIAALYFEARVRHKYEPESAGAFVHRMITLAARRNGR
jgi:hypothetical protein